MEQDVLKAMKDAGKPVRPGDIAKALGLSIPRVKEILDALEKRRTYLFRNDDGDVLWAYPVTAAKTPHRLSFRTGEALFAA